MLQSHVTVFALLLLETVNATTPNTPVANKILYPLVDITLPVFFIDLYSTLLITSMMVFWNKTEIDNNALVATQKAV
jgi:hypothetical protein